ncbi:MAG TPA: DUF3365 domain-containing protein [Flavobacteriaceae bacterium]|nr:DUF3365 domain-containing protein [Flavobacteriaceae bacterium]
MKMIISLTVVLMFFSCKQSAEKYEEITNSEKYSEQLPLQDAFETKGMEYIAATQQLLGGNLITAIQEGGPIHALEFCNIEAIPLTSKFEKEYNAGIKRVSDRNRNPENIASASEKKWIESFGERLAKGEKPEPVVVTEGTVKRLYFPIVTNALCLQCHGKPEKIDPEVLQKIKQLYPNDLAVGYDVDEVRGLWRITK